MEAKKLKRKLISMRYTKKQMQSRHIDYAFVEGWTDCINVLLIWLNKQSLQGGQDSGQVGGQVQIKMPSEEDINLLTYYISKDRNINLPNIDTLCDMDDLFKEIYQANRRHDFGEAAKKGYRAVINKWLKQSQPKEESDER